MIDSQPDISLEQAIKKTRDAGITLNFDKGQTVAADLFQLQQDIKKTNSSIETIKWIFAAILVGAVLTTLVLLADYVQFAIKAYDQFSTKIEEQRIDHKTIESIKTDIKSIKNALNRLSQEKK
jgi:hypothetical protein